MNGRSPGIQGQEGVIWKDRGFRQRGQVSELAAGVVATGAGHCWTRDGPRAGRMSMCTQAMGCENPEMAKS